ncbi:carbohydrate-binding domain-containing protein [Butyrivibrio sp. AC2005]|uniref:carbohydrate-binding domain-containing protein n=1 Tax=Butyrivibrio sp. AC2005 TaxID=1280672 RepID=UPI0003F763E1|nr:carbohydrate-binding domain-containing protein [Butyrivibrio sp. AC2005]
MKRKTLPIIFATGMVLGICAAACGAAGTVTNANDATDTSVIIESEDTEKTAENISNTETVSTVNMSTDTTTIGAVTSVSELDLEGMFTERDIDTGYDESNSTIITLSDSSAEVTGEGVNADGTTITITSEGTYIFSGELKEGQIIVDVDDSEKVQIVLNGVTITNDDSACIYVKCADKVFVTLAQGTENSLSDSGSEYIQEDSETNVDGVIYSKDDITFNGSGSLTINASYANGIVGKDDVKFTGGTYNITAVGNAIEGKDSVRINNGNFNLISGKDKDGIHTSNEEESGKGYVYIEGGDITINAQDDGIHAATVLYICGGNIDVTESYEGLEGDTIEILDGTIKVKSSDDGLNASTSTSQDESGFGQMGGGMDYDENAYIHICGGDIYVNADGDGIDSNGDIYIDGGYVVVDGPVNDGNGPLDKGGTAYISGGTVIAVGSSGMVETFSSESEQYSILYGFESSLEAGTEITITDNDGNTCMGYTLNKTASSVVFSSEDLAEGEYTITAGDFTDTITVSDKSTTAGASVGTMGGHGGAGLGQGRRMKNEMLEGQDMQNMQGEKPEGQPPAEMQNQDGQN